MSSWFKVPAGITSTHFPASWTVHFFQRSVGTSQNRSLPGQSSGSQRSYCEVALPCRENTHKGYDRIILPLSWLTHPKTGAASLEVFFGRKWSDFLLRQCLQEVTTQIEKVHFVLSPGDDGSEIVEDLAAFDDENLSLSADVLFNCDMGSHIRGLADLVPTLQRLLCEESQSTGERHNCTSITTFHVTDSARQYVMQIRDKYRNAPTTLVERLGEANWQRFVRIRGKKYEVEGLDQDPESEEMRLSFRSAFVPTDFHDSGLGTSVTFGHHASRSVASHTSFLSSQSDARKGRLAVPPTPAEVHDGQPFICPICEQKLADIRNRTEWK